MQHQVAILAVPGVQLLDVSGPLDVFAEANRVLKRTRYGCQVIGLDPGEIRTSSGVRVMADRVLAECDTLRLQTFLLAGAPEIESFVAGPAVLDRISHLCQRSQRFGSVCSGALLLAQTGLLQHKRITTHWACAALLRARFPAIQVDADALYVADGRVRTAAGVTSGLDLALRLVEEDLGADVAQEVAARLVMFFRRPVDQSHFVRGDRVTLAGRAGLQDLQRWAIQHLEQVRNVTTLADRLQISERHLTRLFRQSLAMTPAQWLERERIAKARQLIEQGVDNGKTLAERCGFASSDVMRRTFVRVTGLTPTLYRRLIRQG